MQRQYSLFNSNIGVGIVGIPIDQQILIVILPNALRILHFRIKLCANHVILSQKC